MVEMKGEEVVQAHKRRRGDVLKWAARAGAGAMTLLLIISAKDVAISGSGAARGVVGAHQQQLLADDGAQGDRIRSETISLLGMVRRRQSLLDAHGMHLKLDADMSALNSIIGKQAGAHTSSLLKTSLSARIIAQAAEVKQQAAKLVGRSKREKDSKDKGLSMGGSSRNAALSAATAAAAAPAADPAAQPAVHVKQSAAPATEAPQVEAPAAAAASETKSDASPFANDRKWSIATEGQDMDNFFDSLDKGAALHEAQARKEHMKKAAEHTADEERREASIEHKAAEAQKSWPKEGGPDVVVKEANAKAANPAPKAAETVSKEMATPSSLLASTGVKAGEVEEKKEQWEDQKAAGMDGAVKPAEAVHKNAKMSASALRKEESDFYSHLSGGGEAKSVKDTRNVKISDVEERKSVEDYFDSQIKSAEAGAKAVHAKGASPELSSKKADQDLKQYWEKQGAEAAKQAELVHEKAVASGGEQGAVAKMTSGEAEADFNKYYDAKEVKEVAAIKAHVKDANPKMSAVDAREDFEDYFNKQKAELHASVPALRSAVARTAAAKAAGDLEKEDVRAAMGEQDSMPGPEASKDMEGYYNKLVQQAKETKAKDEAAKVKEVPEKTAPGEIAAAPVKAAAAAAALKK